MKKVEISTETNGVLRNFVVECDRQDSSLTLILENGVRKKYSAQDIYICLGLLRADFPATRFLCKGSKLNVYPSRMASQMAGGVVAYELTLGKPSDLDDIVNIFDYEDTDITNDIQQQHDFYKRWLESLAG